MRAYTAAALAALVCATSVAKAERDEREDRFERHQFELRTLTNRADLISGGDALVEVSVPRNVPLHHVKLRLNGKDVTASFVTDAGARTMRGVLTGLREGRNAFVAESNGRGEGRPSARLTITNHRIGGPVLSGEQITPFFCATPTPELATPIGPLTNQSGLSTRAIDAQCNIATETKVWYRTTATGCSLTLPDANTPPANPCYKPYVPGPAPADMATTTTDAGLTVPFIVRVERGTMNRGIYDIAVLFDPSKPWTALAPQAQWNGKVLYQFGASTGQPRRQFRSATNWTGGEFALSRGYLIAQSSMTDSALNSNRVTMAETVMMMKEHIGDTFGPVKFTIGTGCSGGSINSNMNASIAPGQLDGITISCAYPDSETTGMEVGDCVVLAEAYIKPQWTALMSGLNQAQINAKKAAINGHPDQTACHGWYNLFGSNGKVGNYVQRFVVDNTTGAIAALGSVTNNCQLPTSMVYDPVTNPTGARCSAWDWAASIWGKAPDGIRARETRDNAGIQYGLKALQAGAVTPEEFVTLNEIIGGIDKDANFQAGRTVADPHALEIAYRAGVVMSGQHVAKTAVIDMRGWDDSLLVSARPPAAPAATVFGIHYQWRSFGIRDRLDKEFGDHGNQVMWRFARTGLIPSASMAGDAFFIMDQWLTNLKADTSRTSLATKVRNAKPTSAFDYCLLTSDTTQSTKVTNQADCDADPFLKPHSSPRQVAGGPRSEEILKCRTKPINTADYLPAVLSSAQLARLAAVFPDGVCDWAAGGVGQQPALSPLDFSGGPGGVPLPPAPRSESDEDD
ncbi:MAG TPA: DUF6351 family protein [Burkholderiales bacterium]|nr:DUF6351 family protein [Burkholderiales bacterium]